jgi:hypothetical protein
MVTGFYYDSNSETHGFIRTSDGTIASFDPKGSRNTTATAINGKGVITGYYVDSNGATRGFTRSPTGRIGTFDAPGATYTYPYAISGGNVAGWFNDPTGQHGFLRAP